MSKKALEKVTVLAAPGKVVPWGGPTRRRFSDEKPQRVTLSNYVRRRIRAGELVVVEDDKKSKPAPKTKDKPVGGER